MHPRRRALDDRLARREAALIDADVIVGHAGTRFFQIARRNRRDLNAFRAELHMNRAGDGGVVLRLDEEHADLFRRGLLRLCARERSESGDHHEDRQHELRPELHSDLLSR